MNMMISYQELVRTFPGNFRTSTLLRKINQGDIKGACDQLRRWTYAGGKQWKGLMTRREIEREICLWGQQ